MWALRRIGLGKAHYPAVYARLELERLRARWGVLNEGKDTAVWCLSEIAAVEYRPWIEWALEQWKRLERARRARIAEMEALPRRPRGRPPKLPIALSG